MINSDYFAVVGLDPRDYLLLNPSTEELDIARFSLCELSENLKQNNSKALYNSGLDYCTDVINLFNESGKDHASYYMGNVCNDILNIIEVGYGYSDGTEWIPGSSVNELINGVFKNQYDKFCNRIILTSEEKEPILIDDIEFEYVETLDIGKIEINLLLDINNNTIDKYIDIYHWFFNRECNKKIILGISFLNNINRFSNKTDVITSMYRGIYFPNYMCKHGSSTCSYTIESHPDKHEKNMNFKFLFAKKDDIRGSKHLQKTSSIHRTHIISMDNSRGNKERVYHLEYNDIIIILDCSKHGFNRARYNNQHFVENVEIGTDNAEKETWQYEILL